MEVLDGTYNGSMTTTPIGMYNVKRVAFVPVIIMLVVSINLTISSATPVVIYSVPCLQIVISFDVPSLSYKNCRDSKEKKQHGGGVGGKGDWKDVDDGSMP
jgi:hypothetical protein